MELKSPKVRILSGKYKGRVLEAHSVSYYSKKVEVNIPEDSPHYLDFPFSEVELVGEDEARRSYVRSEQRRFAQDIEGVSTLEPEPVEECSWCHSPNGNHTYVCPRNPNNPKPERVKEKPLYVQQHDKNVQEMEEVKKLRSKPEQSYGMPIDKKDLEFSKRENEKMNKILDDREPEQPYEGETTKKETNYTVIRDKESPDLATLHEQPSQKDSAGFPTGSFIGSPQYPTPKLIEKLSYSMPIEALGVYQTALGKDLVETNEKLNEVITNYGQRLEKLEAANPLTPYQELADSMPKTNNTHHLTCECPRCKAEKGKGL